MSTSSTIQALFNGLIPRLRLLAVPIGLLLLAHLSIDWLSALPPAWYPLLDTAPMLAALLATGLAAAMHQGRLAFAGITLAIGAVAVLEAISLAHSPFVSAALFSAYTLLLPLNLTLFCMLRERGLYNVHGVTRLGWIGLQLAAVALVVHGERTDWLLWISQPFLPALLQLPGMTDAAVVAFAAALAIQLWLALRRLEILDATLFTATVCALLTAMRVGFPAAPETYLAAGGLILAMGLVLHTHQIAYRDDLTRLPARRALNQKLDSLGRRYTLAMLDVDHFKQFNDRHGHDVGDQVLRLVAGQLRRVGGGGKPYRYGGEEFTIVFSGRDREQVMDHLEAVRENIADYRMKLRAADRPNRKKAGKARRGRDARGRDSVSVTISIGVASANEALTTPEAVLKAADQALYRAKKAGRNRVAT